MALITVVWAIGLLSAMAVSLAWSSTVSSRLASHSMDIAVVDALAEAGVSRAVLSLLDVRPEARWRRDGAPRTFEFNGTRMEISVQDELGRIDLNHADVRLLGDLLRSAGLDPRSAEFLAARIADWRNSSSLHGAHATDTRPTKSGSRPRGGSFQSVDEMLLVDGMTPDLFRRIEPALTVYSGRALVDPLVAPREVLLAVPGMATDKVDLIIDGRRNQTAAGSGEAIPLQGRAFTIRVEVAQLNRPAVREAVVRLTGKAPQPYWTLNWKAR